MATASEISLSSSSLPLVSTHSSVSRACRSTQAVKMARKARNEARTTRMRSLSRCRCSSGSAEAIGADPTAAREPQRRASAARLGPFDRFLGFREAEPGELAIALDRLDLVALREQVLDLGVRRRIRRIPLAAAAPPVAAGGLARSQIEMLKELLEARLDQPEALLDLEELL